MKIKECIDKVDSLKPNQYSEETKIEWLSSLDAQIHTDIIDTHELNDGETETTFVPYTVDSNVELIAPFPYDELYPAYLKMKIDEENQETARYNNSATLFNSYYTNYEKWYNKTHRPVNKNKIHIW